MSVFEHGRTADRILHAINADALSVEQRIALAHAHAALARADAADVGNLIALLRHVDELPPIAKLIILARIRRRLGIVPPAAEENNVTPNGGA